MNLDALNKATQGKTRTTGISPFSEIEISRIYANPQQPRKNFENIEELADSIMTHGLIQPIVVVAKENGSYMIIGGERRFRATLHAGIKTIKAHILSVDDEKVQELTLIENIQRSDLSDFEIAVHIGALWESGRYASKTELADAIGKSQTYLSKAFSVLKLDDAVVADIKETMQDIPLSVLDEIARVKEPAVQKEVYDKYVNKEIVRDDIKSFKSPAKEKKLNTKSEVLSTVDWIRKLVKEKAILKDDCIECEPDATGCFKFHKFENSYERIIYDLALEIEELKRKELYIISYQAKSGTPNGGGYRVRAFNRDEAIELGKEFYKLDKKMIFSALTQKELEESISKRNTMLTLFLDNKNRGSVCDHVIQLISELPLDEAYKITIEEV